MNCPIRISWQLWARSADLRSLSAITQLFEEILPYRQTLTPHRYKTTLIEILPQSLKDDPNDKDDPDGKDDPNDKNTILIPPLPIS